MPSHVVPSSSFLDALPLMSWSGKSSTSSSHKKAQYAFPSDPLPDFSHSPQDDLYEYCYQVKRTIREILAEFRNVKIPIEYIFDVFPPMRPRQFSIASSGKVLSPLSPTPPRTSVETAHSARPPKSISVSPSSNIGRSSRCLDGASAHGSSHPCKQVLSIFISLYRTKWLNGA
jgi:hypothetical protein